MALLSALQRGQSGREKGGILIGQAVQRGELLDGFKRMLQVMHSGGVGLNDTQRICIKNQDLSHRFLKNGFQQRVGVNGVPGCGHVPPED